MKNNKWVFLDGEYREYTRKEVYASWFGFKTAFYYDDRKKNKLTGESLLVGTQRVK